MKLLRYLLPLVLALSLLVACVPTKQETVPPLPLKVMSFNIRYDNPGDSINSWCHRKEGVVRFIKTEQPDLFGAQEVLKHQLDDLLAGAPEYASIGVGRDDGVEEGEYSPIIYLKDKFTPVDQGYFWLSETPDRPSLGWDAACKRVVTWAVMQEVESGREFFFCNTHLDHVGQIARRQSAEMLLRAVADHAGDRPVILTGDFNSDPSDAVILSLTDPDTPTHLTDSYTAVAAPVGPGTTFHDFGRIAPEERLRIDYIFVRGDVTVKSVRIVDEPDEPGHVYLSDHHPVLADLELGSSEGKEVKEQKTNQETHER